MSHTAMNWALTKKQLTPSQWIVLIKLADRHNPDHGCFPSIDRIADDCNMSRSTVQRVLSHLESINLISREHRPAKHGGLTSNMYHLNLEDEFDWKPQGQNEQTPRSTGDMGVVSNRPCKQVKNKQVNKFEIYDRYFDEIWGFYPKKVSKPAAKSAFYQACKRATPEHIVKALQEFADHVKGRDPQYIPHLATWLNQDRWNDVIPVKKSTDKTFWDNFEAKGEMQ